MGSIAVFFVPETDSTMKYLLVLLIVSGCSQAAPHFWSSNENQSNFWDAMSNYGNKIATALSNFGHAIYNLPDDIKRNFNQFSSHYERLHKLELDTSDQLNVIFENIDKMVENDTVPANLVKEERVDLKRLEDKFQALRYEIGNSTVKGSRWEKTVKESIKELRYKLTEKIDTKGAELMQSSDWLKLQDLRAREVIIDSLRDLSNIVTDFFNSLDQDEDNH